VLTAWGAFLSRSTTSSGLRLLDNAKELSAFLNENKGTLKLKSS